VSLIQLDEHLQEARTNGSTSLSSEHRVALREVQANALGIYGRLELERAINWALEELGEFAQAVRRQEPSERLAEELGQIFAWVLCLGNICGVDIAEAADAAIQEEVARQFEKHGRLKPYRGGASAVDDAQEVPTLPSGSSRDAARAEVDQAAVATHVRALLQAIGEDPEREGLRRTPERVASMFEEIFSGVGSDPAETLDVLFDEGHDELVMVKDIPLYSVCEHHLIPFIGQAHVAYLPGVSGHITGLSKLARLVDTLARRPQVQERLTTQIADTVDAVLEPRGVLVVVEAEHLCMSMRGVRKPGTRTVTSAIRGYFRENDATRSEALQLLLRN